MPWAGGVYTRGYPSWTNDANANLPISATKFDTEDNDFAAGLNNCLTIDGLNKPNTTLTWAQALSVSSLAVTAAGLPQNGIYLPSASTLGFATAGTARGSVNATGNWNLSVATAGIATLTAVGSNSVDSLALDCTGTLTNLDWLTVGVLKAQASYSNSTTTLSIGGAAANVSLSFTTGATTSRMTLAASNSSALQTVDDGGTFQTVGWRDLPQNSQTVSYQLVLADRGKQIAQQTSATTITIPANASVAFPIGTTIVIFNNSGGNISIAITTDTMFIAASVTTGTRTLASNGIATIMKTDATHWAISGPGVT